VLTQIALQFVQEPQTRFELAIECGNLPVAVEMARTLDKPALWTALAQAALSQGNIQIVEHAYQKLKNFEKLSFLYLITGDTAKLERMGKIAEHRGDYGSEFQNSLWTGNVESRIRIFKELDLCIIFRRCFR
jgi:coatomer subunit alpha